MGRHNVFCSLLASAICLVVAGSMVAQAAGRGAAPPASAPATKPAPVPAYPTFPIVKPAPLPKGMEDFKTTETAQRTTIKGARAADAPPEPGYLGVSVANKNGKITVSAVAAESPALKAGIATDDVILNVDGHVPSDTEDFRDLVQAISPGTVAHISAVRGSATIDFAVLFTAPSHPLSLTGANDHPSIGIRMNDDTNTILQINQNSNAARTSLRAGDVITQVDGIKLDANIHLDDFLLDRRVNDVVNISALRNGQVATFKLQLEPDPNTVAGAAANGGGRRGGAAGGVAGGNTTYFDRLGQVWRRDTLRLAIIGIDYPDIKHNASISNKAWEDALFSHGTYRQTATGQVAYGSEFDYYFDQSYGQLKINGNMIPWVTVSQGRAVYSQGSGTGQDRLLLNEAVEAITTRDGRNTLDTYDAFIFVYAGPRVQTTRGGVYWPHKSTFTYGNRRVSYVIIPEMNAVGGAPRMTDISVPCHESGHILGLPDLYAQPENPGSEGVGQWCVMSQQAGNGRPQCMSAWCREQMGWLHPVIIDPSVKQKLVLGAVEDSPTECYKVLVKNDGSEYFLLENRRRKSWDASLPADGLLVWRVTANRPILEESHGVDGPPGPNSFLASVPFPTASNDSFTPFTTPSSRSKLGGGNQVYLTNIKRMADGRISFWIGYDIN